MSDFAVSEYDLATSAILAIHFVPIKHVADKGFYREVQSWDAFCNPVYQRNKTKLSWYIVRWKDDWAADQKAWNNTCEKFELPNVSPPMIYYKSMDDFYNRIGYDRKTKKYKE